MKKKKRYYFFVLVLAIMVIISSSNNYDNITLSIQKRSAARDQWFLAVADMVAITNDPEAGQVLNYLMDKAYLAAPTKIGGKHSVRVVEMAKNPGQDWFLFVPINEQDAKQDPHFAFIYEGNSFAAMFMPYNRSICINIDNQWSSFGKTIILLHEAYHAFKYLNEYYDWEDGQTYAWKEKETHQFQNRLTSILGGKRYQSLIKNEAARIAKQIEKDGTYSFSPVYELRLDEIFGEALSEKEKRFRHSSYTIQLYFEVLDLQYDKDAESYKANFLHGIYIDQGIIDPATDRIITR